MKKKQIVFILICINLLLGYLIINSINSEIEFQKIAKERISENIQKLKDLRQVQIAYKKNYGSYADNFNDLIYFLENDSISIIKAIGETPDSISEEEALKLEIISRDTGYVLAKESVFDNSYIENRDNKNKIDISTLTNVPYSNMKYKINAGEIEKGKVIVQVFEISTTYKEIFTGLDANNKSYNLHSLLKVGSMEEASLNGNWGE
tara:strand:- start:7514 stop:8131 length:618 start_codon:yes stop_codon:yes gene_type:complete